MKKMNISDQTLLIEQIQKLKTVSARDPQAAVRGRARFLTEASQIREAASIRKTQRLIGWNLIFRKEMPVMKFAISTLIVLILLASTSTVFAAQNDTPIEPLYGVKTLSEDVGLWLTANPDAKLERLMELAQVRVREMTALAEQDEIIPEKVLGRLHLHIETALQLAAGQNDEDMHESLLQIQSQLQTQEQVMTQLQNRSSDEEQPALEQARVMTQEQLQLASQGVEDPQTFRNRYQHRFQNAFATDTPIPTVTDVPSETATPTPPSYGPGPYTPGTPGSGNPTPGTYGPGPNPTPGGTGNGGNGGSGGKP
jgi:hypothetical protein